MNTEVAELKTLIEKFIADVAAYKQSVNDAVAKAVAAHDIECSADIKTLADEIKAVDAALVLPPFEPSNN